MFTLNGIGTKLYGKRNIAADGSYISTKWFVIFYFPAIPLGSYRVMKLGSSYGFLNEKTDYRLIKEKFNWRQVLNCYLISLFIGPLFVYLIIGIVYIFIKQHLPF